MAMCGAGEVTIATAKCGNSQHHSCPCSFMQTADKR